MVTLVDSKYFGRAMRNARRHNCLGADDVAKMFSISVRQLHKYEQGKEVIPDNILQSIFYHGFCLLRCRRVPPKHK